jgi:hypothetical protein
MRPYKKGIATACQRHGEMKGLEKEGGRNKMKYSDLVVWQKAHQLFLDIAEDVERFPNRKAAQVIADQILRSSGSISANIAEGNGRRKGREYEHYLIRNTA